MIGLVRAAVVCATMALGLVAAQAADKAFKRDDLADSAVKLEAQIKSEAGPVSKSSATLRTDADTAFKRADFRTGLQILGQIAATTPEDSANWLKLAKTIFQIRSASSSEQTFLLERASTAAYIAYQRAGNAAEEADALAVLGRAMSDRKLWRPALDSLRLSLDMREVAEVRGQYEKMRDQHGFRLLDYTVDSDGASPRACFQFSEDLAKRVDFSPFLALAGTDKPALSAEGKQLCVDGLKHGERYNINLRAGLPSTVKETLPKSAEFNVYVRDRKPFVRFTGRAYVLPRTGQRGIPLVSVNTPAVNVNVFRIGDRNLINTVIDSDFQKTLSSYQLGDLGDEKGVKVWTGELATATTLNQDVITAFPVDQALGDLQPGVYVMTASAKGPGSDDDGRLATQWFIVSDMGLSAFSGNDGVHVFVNSLASTEAVGKAEVRLIARNNEILATRKTDDSGHVLFEAGLARGEGGLSPALLTVMSEKSDYAFLSLKTTAFDLTDRGVSGRVVPSGADAFVYAERGVYRSTETVYLTALLRDGQGNAMTGGPLTLVIERPDGVEFRRAVLPDQGAGGRSMVVPLNSAVPTGTWRVRAFTDPKGSAVGETTFMVEDYIPERIEFNISSKEKMIKAEVPVELKVDGRFLYGAPASGLQLEGDMLVTSAASGRPGYPGYQFGVADEETASNERTPIENLPEADANGVATFPVSLAKASTSTRPQEAQIFIRMAEAGGRAVERKLVLPVAPATPLIGIKPLFGDKSVAEGDKAEFDVVFVAPDGKQLPRDGLRYELLKMESRYQWYRQNSSWEYEPVKSTSRVADGDLTLSADKAARVSLAPQPGRYRLDVKSTEADGPVTSVQFDVGWYSDGSADTPDLLETSIDKPEYASGDTMVVSVNARTAGKLTINVLGDRLLTTQTVDVKEGTQQVKLSVGKDWGTGAYVLATLRRPLDAAALRMPGRAIGLKWFGIDKKARTLQVALSPPPLVRPGTALKIPVKLGGLNPGEDAKIVVAAVDVGILNLTNYKPPAPDDFYLGQRRLTSEIRDLYGQLIDGMQGTRGQLKTGGDGAGAELQGSPPTQKPLALYSGIVTVGPDGSAEISFDIPEFAGTARVMAVAWSATRLGRATTDVTVRDPVVLTATLPRFLLNGDRGTMSFDLDNVEGAPGDYTISVKTTGPVKVSGNPSITVKLAAKQRTSMSLAIDGGGAGTANLDVDIKGPNGLALARHYALDVKAATQVLARRSIRTLAKGESLTLTSDMFTDLVSGTGSVSLSVSLSTALDAATILKALDRYPHGCSEQITSRALPLLYVNDLAAGAHLAMDTAVDQRIRDAIERLLARQGSNGSFGLWSAGGDDAWLDAYVTDFLTRAREKGFAVPDGLFKSALDRIRNSVVNANEPEKDGGRDLAYGLYVLARNGAAPIGDLRYLADTKLNNLATPIAKSQLAAALALVGDKARAERVYGAALDALVPKPVIEFGRVDYGSALRDAAALVSLASEGNAPRATLTQAVQRVEVARGLSPYTSTQENAWLVLASRALSKETMALDIDGSPIKTAAYRSYKAEQMVGKPVKITNTGDAPVQAVVSVSGSPVTPEPAASNGFKIERNYFTLDGKPADISKAKQNDRFAVVLKITEAKPEYGHIMVADYLPAGLEIDNPRLVSSGDKGTLDWIEDGEEPENTEFRDDRFTAAIDRASDDTAVFTVAYVVRAVSPGKYVLPQAYVEDMYNPSRYGRTGTGTVEVRPAK
ncbi:alpha-2-macroglobulin family protein [Bradyrhizobium sp. AUGA SZCCT0240]|uniref:alpha-2-macroglobulin family protein n=1 Tax=unclassified Bradyrhizobium TaxID=2631580 RepID=UPI001BA63EE0|nr:MULTISPECIES: alpha-2-macroglobulin [unclassified Bradyrhizobium]MBR1196624.1 alpha-2-macroglobulin family protein [Bradyrhizobium sp. AUGA SZCCT0158]MBR1242373.1 alpha-2-macroglobulin family protein [Bradyrhizobium sp. AUGA SZCCT0274]MBR1257152.1 alpha-2-macroglobulin family protein [Bradyrhizobium sp. AUGA SZCCT0240]